LLAACSDAFDPFVESDRTFALYGFLDARRDTQYVRVQAITEHFDHLVREADVTARALPDHMRGIRAGTATAGRE